MNDDLIDVFISGFQVFVAYFIFFMFYTPFQVFDATNSTAERRKMIYDIVVEKWGYKLFFVESICDDPLIIEQNIMVSTDICQYLKAIIISN